MTVEQIAEKLALTPIVKGADEKEVTGCYIGDLLSWVMCKAEEGQLWLTVMGNVNVVAVARLTDVAGVLLCEDAPLDMEAKEAAETAGIPIYKTSRGMYQTALELGKLLDN